MVIDFFTLFPEWFQWFTRQRHVQNALRDGHPENAAYASKAALFDESIWLLWRMRKKN